MATTLPPPRTGWPLPAPMHRRGRSASSLCQRLALLCLLVLVAAACMAALANFAWPWAVAEDRLFYAGRTEQFPPGTVTEVAAIEGENGRPRFFLVRLDGGELLALVGRDGDSGCRVEFRTDLVFDGRTGWFRDTCWGSTYDMAGDRVFGPARYGLSRLAVEVRDGGVFVNPSAVTRRLPVRYEGYGDQAGGELRALPFALPRPKGAQ